MSEKRIEAPRAGATASSSATVRSSTRGSGKSGVSASSSASSRSKAGTGADRDRGGCEAESSAMAELRTADGRIIKRDFKSHRSREAGCGAKAISNSEVNIKDAR